MRSISLIAPAFALALAASCAGSGRYYPCNPDAGDCGSAGNLPDGGRPDTPFVSQASTVWHDGQHDASTDLVRFSGALYAAFRHASAWQLDSSAQVFIIRSDDKGQSWRKVAAIDGGGRDLREPKLAVFRDRLWVFATAWEAADPSAHRTTLRAAVSDDGATFGPLREVLPQATGLAAWRPRAVGSVLVLSAWNADELLPSSTPNHLNVLESGDGASFTLASTPAAAGPGARQGELFVRANGDHYLALPERADNGAPERQTFCHSPALSDWTCWSVAGRHVDAPVLFEWNGVLFVAGRHDTGSGRKRTAIWQVLEDDHDLSLIADVPQGFGDTGAPGVVLLDRDHALLTFHTTSPVDARVQALGHEPTEVEAQSLGLPADVLSVVLSMPSAAAGR